MELFHLIAWLIYPYSAAAVFAMGIVWHFDAPDVFVESRKSGRVFTYIAIALWIFTTGTGIWLVAFPSPSADLPVMLDWLVGFLHFNPDIDALQKTSLLLQIHLFLLFTFILFFSFTNYVNLIFRPFYYVKSMLIGTRRPDAS